MDMLRQTNGLIFVLFFVALPIALGFARQDSVKHDMQRVLPEVIVTEQCTFEPKEVVVKAGQTVRIGIVSSMQASVSDSLLIPELGISLPLSGSGPTFVEVTPDTPGDYSFWCSACLSVGQLRVES